MGVNGNRACRLSSGMMNVWIVFSVYSAYPIHHTDIIVHSCHFGSQQYPCTIQISSHKLHAFPVFHRKLWNFLRNAHIHRVEENNTSSMIMSIISKLKFCLGVCVCVYKLVLGRLFDANERAAVT